jgi:hypothetical protein
MEVAVAIPNTNPLNIFGTTVVAENAVIASASQTISADVQLSVDGSTYIRFVQATGANLNITLPFAVNASGAIDYSGLAGQTRFIFNSSGANLETLTIRRVATVDGNGNPVTYANIATLQSNGGAIAGNAGVIAACDGSTWIVCGGLAKATP